MICEHIGEGGVSPPTPKESAFRRPLHKIVKFVSFAVTLRNTEYVVNHDTPRWGNGLYYLRRKCRLEREKTLIFTPKRYSFSLPTTKCTNNHLG